MEQINLHIEKLPEGFYLAISGIIQGLLAQGQTEAGNYHSHTHSIYA